MFTGHEYADGADTIIRTLKKNNITASFFLTGDFLRNKAFDTQIKRIVSDGHYIGPHSDKHLLYHDWSNRDSNLVSKLTFGKDLIDNKHAVDQYFSEPDPRYFIPPYEWYNDSTSAWSRELGYTLINFTPGTRSTADYTRPTETNYRDSRSIMESITTFEKSSASGLNGFILLLHVGTHPERTDKMYNKLDELITLLLTKGYHFQRIDQLLKPH